MLIFQKQLLLQNLIIYCTSILKSLVSFQSAYPHKHEISNRSHPHPSMTSGAMRPVGILANRNLRTPYISPDGGPSYRVNRLPCTASAPPASELAATCLLADCCCKDSCLCACSPRSRSSRSRL